MTWFALRRRRGAVEGDMPSEPRISAVQLLPLLRYAYINQDWRVLGYASWQAYIAGEFSAERLGVTPEEHSRAVGLLGEDLAAAGLPDDRRSVYFLQPVAGGLIKVGVAADVSSRFNEIQRMSPVPLTVLAVIPGGGQRLERDLHKRFAAARQYGEWFSPVGELLAYIEANGVEP